jgi:hypothetical protein
LNNPTEEQLQLLESSTDFLETLLKEKKETVINSLRDITDLAKAKKHIKQKAVFELLELAKLLKAELSRLDSK